MLSQILRFDEIADGNRLTKKQMSANKLMIDFLNPFGLVLPGYFRSPCSMEYTTTCSTREHAMRSFSHISPGSVLSIILLKILSLTSFLIICMGVQTAMQFSLLFCSQNDARLGLGPFSMRFFIFFCTSRSLIRSDNFGRLLKLVSFLQWELL